MTNCARLTVVVLSARAARGLLCACAKPSSSPVQRMRLREKRPRVFPSSAPFLGASSARLSLMRGTLVRPTLAWHVTVAHYHCDDDLALVAPGALDTYDMTDACRAGTANAPVVREKRMNTDFLAVKRDVSLCLPL